MTMHATWDTALFVAASLFFSVIVFFFEPALPAQILLLAPLVVLLGLPHGAFDMALARKIWPSKGLWWPIGFSVFYVGLALLVLAVWLLAPGFALIAFLAYSAYHFSGDWAGTSQAWRCAGGLSTVGAPALTHHDDVATIFEYLVPTTNAAPIAAGLFVIGALALILSALAAAQSPRPKVALEIAMLWLAAVAMPPLIYFIVYFCFLHSPRHLAHAYRDLYDVPGAVRSALGIMAMTIVGAVCAWAFLAQSGPADAATLKTVFIGLAALTVPHMILIDRWMALTRFARIARARV